MQDNPGTIKSILPGAPEESRNGKTKPSWFWRLVLPIFFLLLVSAVYWPIIFGSDVFMTDWALFQDYPVLSAMEKSIKLYHELPLWASSYYSGYPSFVSHTFANLHLLTIGLLEITDFITAYHVTVVIYLSIALMLAYALARYIALSRMASIIAALTYAFCQLSIIMSYNVAVALVFLFPPFIILVLLKIHEHIHPLRYALLGAAGLALALIAALPDTIFFTIVAVLGIAVYLDWQTKRASASAGRFNTTKYFVLLCAIGALLATPSILPTLRYINFSTRAVSFSFGASGGSEGLFLKDLPWLIYPGFFPGIPYWPQPRYMVYVGTLSLILGIWGFMQSHRNRFGRSFFWLAVGVFVTILPYSPTYWLLQRLPPFNRLHENWKLLPVLVLTIAIFAGIGFDSLRDTFRTATFQRYIRVWQWLTGLVFAGAILFTIAWHSRLLGLLEQALVSYLIRNNGEVKPEVYYREVFRHFAEKFGSNLSFTNYQFSAAIVFLGIACLVFTLWGRGKIRSEKLAVVTCAVVVLNFLLIWQKSGRFISRDVMEMPPTFRAIAEQKPREPFRVAFAMPSSDLVDGVENVPLEEEAANTRVAYAFGVYNSPELFSFDGIDGADPLVSGRYERMLDIVGPSRGRPVPSFASLPLKEKTRIVAARMPLYAMMNIRYLVTPYALPEPWRKITDAEVNKLHLSVYENPAVLPRAYFPETVRYLPVDDEQSFTALMGIKDFGKVSLIECLPDCPPKPEDRKGAAAAHLTQGSPRRFSIETNTASDQWLIVSDSNLPYWRARIDGKPAIIYTANYIYRGVFIPAGKHLTEFDYPGLFYQAWHALNSLVRKSPPYASYRAD